MEIKILDSILHGELRPWIIDTSNKKKFGELLKAANSTPQSYRDLQAQVSSLLNDHSSLRRTVDTNVINSTALLQLPFYENDFPKPNDFVKQFYAVLIAKESLKLSNFLLQITSGLEEDIDKRYEVNQTLKSLRVLAAQTAKELQAFIHVPDEQSNLTHFALYILKQELINLFFETQERFRSILTEFETVETFHLSYLPENDPQFQLKSSTAYFEFQINKLISKSSFSYTEAITLLNQIPQKKETEHLKTALENYIFFHANSIQIGNPTMEILTEPDTMKQYLEEAKNKVNSKMNNYYHGHQRLDIATDNLNELQYIQTGSLNNSVPSMLYGWLLTQRDMYEKNAGTIFAPVESGEQRLDRKKKPVAKQERATVTQNQAYAFEHLKFLSGTNHKQEKIMSDADFKKLIGYTNYLIENNSIPQNTQPIPQVGISSQHLRYTFYIIHKGLYGTQEIKKEWIDFLHAVFKQFSNMEWKTTKTKFSTKPAKYDSDMKSA